MSIIKQGKSIYFIMSLVLTLVIFLFFRGKQEKPFQGFFTWATSPLTSFFNQGGIWVEDKISFVSSIGDLKKQNEALLEESLLLKAKIANLEDIKNENEILRKEISLAPRDKYNLYPAQVLGRDMSSQLENFLIDQGSKNGIVEGMAVIVGEGILIGKIDQVMPETAWVKTIRANDFKVNVEILNSELKGIALGQFGTSIGLDMVEQGIEIVKGDTVITSGAGGSFPRGLLVGYVNDIFSNSEDLFQKASLYSPIQYDSLRIVWLVKNK